MEHAAPAASLVEEARPELVMSSWIPGTAVLLAPMPSLSPDLAQIIMLALAGTESTSNSPRELKVSGPALLARIETPEGAATERCRLPVTVASYDRFGLLAVYSSQPAS